MTFQSFRNFRSAFLAIIFVFSFHAVGHAGSHDGWKQTYAQLLETYVHPSGVDYAAWHANADDVAALASVVKAMGAVDATALSPDDRLAFYINAYNAWMLHLVFKNYPVNSVTEIRPDWGVFREDLITVNGQPSSLDKLEKGLILKDFGDARAHFAVNCASVGCPPLQGKPFTGANLDAELDAASAAFVNSPEGVRVTGNTASLSKIFEWYQSDFKPDGGLVGFVNKYRTQRLPENAKVVHHTYDWNLNQSRDG
ncbi:MAG: DUF547 domain-containing protein [Opitutales bacterium]